jgi:uncharacterized protein
MIRLNSDVFISKRNYYDDANFPNGFQRSGDFTIFESEILTSNGYIMNKLYKGEISPEAPEHKHFIDVINGIKEIKFLEEHIFVKYLELLKNKDKCLSPLTKV